MTASIRQQMHALAEGRLTPTDLVSRAWSAIDRHDATVNAVPTKVDRQRVMARSQQLETALRDGEPVGPLTGMPYVAKDTHRTAGLRTTYGSPIYADHVPQDNDPIVDRLLDAGCVLLGKSNVPEFAAGSQTFNTLFGTTRNPYSLEHTVGGSSGGAACALATGMAIVACGSDLAASLRNPASFCGVVGMRPTSRSLPALAMAADRYSTLNMVGTLGRTVDDVRLGYRAVFTPSSPRPLADWSQWHRDETQRTGRGATAGASGARATPRPPRKLRIAWTIDAGEQMPVAVPVHRAMRRAAHLLAEAGVELIEAYPDMSGSDECFQALRGEYFVENYGQHLADDADRLKDTVRWNIEFGLSLDPERVAAAKRMRGQIFERMRHFMTDIDAWLLPTAQVLPILHRDTHPTEINGVPMTTYIDWVKSCYWLTLCGNPAISIPAGLEAAEQGPSLPVGLQVVGHWGDDEGLLDVAETLEALLAPLNAPGPVTPVGGDD